MVSFSWRAPSVGTTTIRGNWRLNAAGATVLALWTIDSAFKASSARGALGWAIFALLAAFVAFRSGMARIVLTSQGVRMCGFLRSRFVPWSAVAGFDTVQQREGHTPRCVVLRTTHGGVWSSMAIVVPRDQAEPILYQLRAAQRAVMTKDPVT